jgi:hypothetical protein
MATKVTCRRGYLRANFGERVVGSTAVVGWSSPSPLLDAAIQTQGSRPPGCDFVGRKVCNSWQQNMRWMEDCSRRWAHSLEDERTERSILSQATSGAGQGVGGTVLRIEAERPQTGVVSAMTVTREWSARCQGHARGGDRFTK